MGHSVQVGLKLDHGLFAQSYRRKKIIGHRSVCMDGEVAVCGISFLVAPTHVMKWEIKHPTENNQEGGERDEGLKREEEVCDSHLKGPKGEPTGGI